MCIIVAKEKNVKLPSEEVLKNCFTNNSDGAGFMYVDKNKVVIDKGYLKYDDFIKHYKKLCKKYHDFKNKALVMHFRIGTSGLNDRGNTHPYPISSNVKDLHSVKSICDIGIAHNGIISDYNPKDDKKNTNDTQEFIMKYLTPLYEHYRDFYKNEYILKGLEDITGSRLVFLTSDEKLYYVGDFEENKGIKYSNSSYEERYWYNCDNYNVYTPAWDTYTHDYVGNEGYVFNEAQIKIDKKDIDMHNVIKLDSEWYIGNGYGIEKVGDRNFYADMYEYTLYEELENGDLILIGEDTYVYDEDYEEIM